MLQCWRMHVVIHAVIRELNLIEILLRARVVVTWPMLPFSSATFPLPVLCRSG